ncbi:MAG: M48 family metallopeptidase [Burkholderiaceae bacterium]
MIDAIYFDGQSTKRHPVTLVIHKRVVAIRGTDIRLSMRLSQLAISEKLMHAPRILRIPQGGAIEVTDPAFDAMLAANRYQEPWVVHWQMKWHLSLLALVSLLAVLLIGYQWGLPWAAGMVAQHLPTSIEKKIGDQELVMVDKSYFSPSKLDPVDQARLQREFAELKQPRGEKTAYHLEFRYSKIGPNAFALPNGAIVMTDQLVMLARNDPAVLAVLSHELGHLQRRHSLRHLLQALGVGAVLNLFIGDVSSILVALPTFMLDQKYSRDFEREADQYAIDMLHANNIPLAPMADLFEKMHDAHADDASADKKSNGRTAGNGRDDSPDEESDDDDQPNKRPGGKVKMAPPPEYFSSHPSDAERIARLRAADQQK